MRLFVAIDVSSEKLDVCFLDSHDTVLKEICLSNDVNGPTPLRRMFSIFTSCTTMKKLSLAWNLLPSIVSILPCS
jgi:hypothetical protein